MKPLYNLDDKVVFKYLTLNKLGIIDSISKVVDLKKQSSFVYTIKEMNPSIAIKEKNIILKVELEKPKPMFRMKIAESTRG